MNYTLDNFYQSDQWRKFREIVIHERTREDGFVYDEITGKPILKAYDIILHHTIFLTEENVNDANISLNPELIQIVSHKTHNIVHNKLGYARREVFLVYGSPLSGKTSYVESIREPGDLVVDMDSIWACVSGCEKYVKPARLNAVVFGVRDYLLDSVRVRRGKWNNAYIIGGYPLISERERMCKMYGAREIYIESSREECLMRLKACEDREFSEWEKYIEEWWRRYTPLAC